MAFRSKVSPFVRSSLSVFRSPIIRRTLTSQSKESASYFRFAGPFVIGATAAGAGLFAASRLYNNNFTFFENVHAATKVICLDAVFICIYIGMEYFWGLSVTYDFMWDIFWQNFDILGLQPRDKAAMFGINTLKFFLEEYSREDGVQFTYQRRECCCSWSWPPWCHMQTSNSC